MTINLWELQSDLIKQCKLFMWKKKRTFAWSIMYLNEWRHFRKQFLLSLRPLFLSFFFFSLFFALFSLHFCLLNYFEIITRTVKSLIATSTYFLLKYSLKTKTWKVLFGCPTRYTGFPNRLNTSLHNQLFYLLTFLEALWIIG